MTDNDIIKALECCTSDGCTCRECPYEDTKHIVNEEFETMSNGKTYDAWSCDEWLKIDLLDLINRQKAEIERLTTLAELGNIRANGYRAMRDKAKNAKAEAIKEFAERLKNRFTEKLGDKKESFFSYSVQREIDKLVKEMTE